MLPRVLERLLDAVVDRRVLNGMLEEKAPDLGRLYPGGKLAGGRVSGPDLNLLFRSERTDEVVAKAE